jgi:steroid 5-alpha reductase family enzyme
MKKNFKILYYYKNVVRSIRLLYVYYLQTKKTGVEPRWVEFFKKTHTKKSGSFVNPHCETLYVSK